MKLCACCGEVKDETKFNWRWESRGIRQSVCRSCQVSDRKDWYDQHAETEKDRTRELKKKTIEEAMRFDFYLYTIQDVFSRYGVGWMIAERESATLAQELIAATCTRQGIQPRQLIIHADRGSSMTSKSVALLMADLGVTKSHSRPHVSNDNSFSEAQFKTLKYRPDYPCRFGCIADARAWAKTFFGWYNQVHHHSDLAILTPAEVHFQRSETVLKKRQEVLQAAYENTPQRFVKGLPVPEQLQKAVWINPPKPANLTDVPLPPS